RRAAAGSLGAVAASACPPPPHPGRSVGADDVTSAASVAATVVRAVIPIAPIAVTHYTRARIHGISACAVRSRRRTVSTANVRARTLFHAHRRGTELMTRSRISYASA